MVACAAAYLKRHGTPQTPADLAGHTCVLYGRERRIGWEFRVDGVARTFDVQAAGREQRRGGARRGDRGRHRAAAGLHRRRALDSGALVPVLDAYAPSPITLNAVFPQHREGFVTLRTFIGFLAERLGDAAPAAKGGRAGRGSGPVCGNAILRMICGEY